MDETKTNGLPTKRSCESRGYRYKSPQFSIKFLSSFSTLCASSSFCREQKGDNIIFGPNNSCFCVLLENKQTNTLDLGGASPVLVAGGPGVSQLRAGAAVAAESGIQHQAAVATDVGERVAV